MGVMLCSGAYAHLPRATEPEPVVRPAKTQKGAKKGASGRTRSAVNRPRLALTNRTMMLAGLCESGIPTMFP